MSMDMFISIVLVAAIFGGLWRYSRYLGLKTGYDLGYEQAKKDLNGSI